MIKLIRLKFLEVPDVMMEAASWAQQVLVSPLKVEFFIVVYEGGVARLVPYLFEIQVEIPGRSWKFKVLSKV